MTITSMSKLKEVSVRELMQKDVVSLRATAPIQEAIETFEEYHISGAPVIDSAGELVGVLSANDITRTEHLREGRIESERREYYLAEKIDEAKEDEAEVIGNEDYSPEVLGRETVGDWMSPSIISVGPEQSLKEACELMTNQSIHRLLVVEDKSVSGILSSFDIVRFLAANL